MTIEIGGQVLDEELAAEPLAKEGDVGPYHRTEVDDHRRFLVREGAQEFRQGFGGDDGIRPSGRRGIPATRLIGFPTGAKLEEIG